MLLSQVHLKGGHCCACVSLCVLTWGVCKPCILLKSSSMTAVWVQRTLADVIVYWSQCSFQCLLNLPSLSKFLHAGNAWTEFPATECLTVDQMLMLSSQQCKAVKEDVSRGWWLCVLVCHCVVNTTRCKSMVTMWKKLAFLCGVLWPYSCCHLVTTWFTRDCRHCTPLVPSWFYYGRPME